MGKRRLSEAERARTFNTFSSLREISLSGETDDPELARMRDEILSDLLTVDSLVFDYYQKSAPGFLAAHQAVSMLPEIEHIASEAVAADRRLDSKDETDWPHVIFPDGRDQRLALSDPLVFDVALTIADQHLACDLDMGGNQYCESELELIKRHKLGPVGPDGKMLNRAFTFPLEYQDYVVMARICIECWIKYVKRNKIIDVRVQEPWQN